MRLDPLGQGAMVSIDHCELFLDKGRIHQRQSVSPQNGIDDLEQETLIELDPETGEDRSNDPE